jgi:xanthine dehydrogenase YagR molybdenum-binding subunit
VAESHAYDPAVSPKLDIATVIGEPIDRVEGVPKVTGRATYAYEYQTIPRPAYGFIVQAAIAKGRILAIDVDAAERAPGVRLVLTHLNAPKQGAFGPPAVANRNARARPVLTDDNIRYFGEPLALVIADSFEQARAAAALIKARYEQTQGAFCLQDDLDRAYRPTVVGPGYPPDSAVGDFAGAFARAPVKIDATYDNGYQNHNPMEPHAALAIWDGDMLTVYVSQQSVASARTALAATLQIAPENIRLISRFIGGGFGSKLPMNAEVVLASLAARVLGRPVKVAQTRPQMFANTGHRPTFRQHIRLGADHQGRLTAIAHEVWGQTARFEEYAENVATFTRSLYAAPNRLTRHRLVPLDMQHGETMRAPGEAPGMLAFECAMDELAIALNIDPVELRLRNEPMLDPELLIPFSSRRLVECLQEGARRFGWDERPKIPAARQEGRRMIGFGMSAGIRPNKLRRSSARVALQPDGGVAAQMDMTDPGTGSYTILTQIAADIMGLPPAAITIELGDSDFPVTPGSGGSFGAGSSCSALYYACVELRHIIARTAVTDQRSPLFGADAANVTFQDGRAIAGNASEALSRIAARSSPAGLRAEGVIDAGDTYQQYSQNSYGAYFAEVQVDMDTAEVRARRMVGVFDVGRVLNVKTARSQLLGGMIWGLGAALHEEGVVDTRFGNFVNHDLAGYHIAAHADIPQIEVIMLNGADNNSNPIGSKAVGELGICGSGAAIANAVYNATGVRIRSFPITLDKLLAGSSDRSTR